MEVSILFLVQGQDSTTLKLCYLSLLLATFQEKTLLEEKTVMVELGESWPRPKDAHRGLVLCGSDKTILVYSRHSKTGHLKTGFIQNPDF